MRPLAPSTANSATATIPEPAIIEPLPAASRTSTHTWHGRNGLRHIASQLWSPSYEELFSYEITENRAECAAGGYALPPTTYRMRLTDEAALLYDARRQRQKRDEMAIALHANNERRWSPSLLARSICYYNSSTRWMQAEETSQRRIASRPTTLRLLRAMRDCRPAPSWEFGKHVHFFVVDQTYDWIGCKKRGARKTVEQNDATGMPIALVNHVYINSVKLHLPASLGSLSRADLARIASNHGSPYTEPYSNMLAPLQPATVQASLLELNLDTMKLVGAKCLEAGVAPCELGLEDIATALYGRPDVDPGGPSEFEILTPLMDTDTKSYDDFIKITQHCGSTSGDECAVNIFCGDGQSVIAFKNLKKKYTQRYADWLIAVGGFHEHAHTMFALTEMFWCCFICFCLDTIGITKVFRVTNNLEHNAYAQHQNVHHVATLAIVSYLVQDVVDPPPELLLRRGVAAYAPHVRSAGGTVMLEYLKGAGCPTQQWQRAARCGDGEKVKKLFAYTVHLSRSVCHKPVVTQIALLALLGSYCTLPSLQTVLVATVSLSLLGRKGSNMYCDRLLEYVNSIQQGKKGNASGAAFRSALDMTTLLRSIMHVRHAFEAAETGTLPGSDPVTRSMLVQARMLQNKFKELLGTDLTVHAADNPFWHTGNPTPLEAGDFRERRPWEWVWRTADGRSAGKARANSESWDSFVRRYTSDNFFAY